MCNIDSYAIETHFKLGKYCQWYTIKICKCYQHPGPSHYYNGCVQFKFNDNQFSIILIDEKDDRRYTIDVETS